MNRRTGWLAREYPSVHGLHSIGMEKNKQEVCTSMTCGKKARVAIEKKNAHGVYFPRTSIDRASETTVWTAYNCIREIGASIRCLKSVLNLRPIFRTPDLGKWLNMRMLVGSSL